MTLPSGWTVAKLADLTVAKVDQGEPSGAPVDYIDIGSLDRDRKSIGPTDKVTAKTAPTRARQWVRQGDVLVSMTRPNLNAVAMVPATLDGSVASTGFDVLRPLGVAPEWVFYRVRSQAFIQDVCKDVQGVVYPAIRPDDVRRHEMPLPPAEEQQRIVEAVESYLSRLDDAIANLERVRIKLKAYRASVLKVAVEGRLVPTEAEVARQEKRSYEPAEELLKRILTERRHRWEQAELTKLKAAGRAPKDDKWKAKYIEPVRSATSGLPELPEGWCWASVEQLAFPEDYSVAIGPFGSNLKVDDYRPSGVPLVFVRNIRAEDFNDGPRTRYVGKLKADELRAHWVRPGEVLVTKMGDPPGDCCLYPRHRPFAVITADCIKFKPAEQISADYIVLAIRSSVAQQQIQSATKGVAQKKISLERFRPVLIPIPPLIEQGRLVEAVDALMSTNSNMAGVVEMQVRRLSRLRQSILRWAFEGKLVDQNPADEPAEKLLARIRAERAAATPIKNTRGRTMKAAS